jgi:anthranilate phosphoribosyltransferase
VSVQHALHKCIAGENLSVAEMEDAMRVIMQGEATPAQIGALLVALRMKGETTDEIAAAARVMREFAKTVPVDVVHAVDIVGTGGDGSHTFNVSTSAAFVAAGAGAKVAKHNNRSVSSRSGSADVLEAAGVKLGLSPAQIAQCLDEVGVAFMFAPSHHGATRHAAGPRRDLGVRTFFNLLGPLTNPAGVKRHLIGVFAAQWVRPVAEVLHKLGSVHALVVHSDDGLDEISIAAPTRVAELKDGAIREYVIDPRDHGVAHADRATLTVADAADSLRLMNEALGNRAGPALDIVLLNAGAALLASGTAATLADGIVLARRSVESGAARRKLDELVVFSGRLK